MSRNRISRALVFAALAASMLLVLPAPAAARVRGGVGIGFYGGYYGPYPWGYYGYPWGPYGYYPYGGYYYGHRPLGEVHIKSPEGKAQIYINGALAGFAKDLKTFYLVPGTYDIEQRMGNDVQKQRVYVLANRSLKLEFDKPGAAPAPGGNPPQAAPQAEPVPDGASVPESTPAPPPPPAPATTSTPAPTAETQNQY